MDNREGSGAPVDKYDLIIVGAGPAGLSFARALAGSGLKMALVEKLPRSVLADPPVDGRDIALTQRSEQTLRELEIWPHIPPDEIAVIRHAKVTNGTSPYALHFDHREMGADYLGPITANHLLRRAAFRAFEAAGAADLIHGRVVIDAGSDEQAAWAVLDDGRRLRASLLVAADSRFSETRRRFGIPARLRDFGRSCIVCRMDHDRGHDDTAFECFHYDRTLAVLPLAGGQSSVVITLPSDQAGEVMAMPEAAFNRDVAARFEQRLGAMTLVGERYIYPLVAVYADRFFGRRFALVGDAAVGMHPVTAHGFNLGLRGAVTLAAQIRTTSSKGGDIGAVAGLRRYHIAHHRAARPLYLGTNMVVGLYTDDRPAARLARNALLHFGNLVRPARHGIMRQLTDKAA